MLNKSHRYSNAYYLYFKFILLILTFSKKDFIISKLGTDVPAIEIIEVDTAEVRRNVSNKGRSLAKP